MTMKSRHRLLPVVTLSLFLSGCGSDDAATSTTTISGSVFAAPVSGAGCEIQDGNGATIVGSITTGADGRYTANLPSAALAGNLMLVCSGGTYTDEADGTAQTAGGMAAYVAGGALGAGSALHATPESTIIHQLVTSHGKSLSDALAAFNGAFGYTPDTSIAPTDATSPASGANDDEKLAGLRAAAFSQLTADLGLSPAQQFVLLDALAKDLSDGALDGVDGLGAITIDGTAVTLSADIQNQFGLAMLNFRAGSRDATGLTDDQIGSLPFAKTALTTSYKVEYIPGAMAAMQGKTLFQIRVTDRTNDEAVTGQNVTLMPMMYMASHHHTTPQEGCSESATLGAYDCSVYYLMASSGASGVSMGYWDLQVMIGGMMGESAHFYPNVMMAMGDTTRADLKGVNDKIKNMMGMEESRKYFLFKSDLSGMTGNHTFKLFIAATENMMSFPAVTSSTILSPGDSSYELPITSMSVEASTDGSSWVAATEDGNGYWSVAGLSGLTNGTQGVIHVRMSINGEQKSTDGQSAVSSCAADTSCNAFTTFTVTPGSSM